MSLNKLMEVLDKNDGGTLDRPLAVKLMKIAGLILSALSFASLNKLPLILVH